MLDSCNFIRIGVLKEANYLEVYPSDWSKISEISIWILNVEYENNEG